jgi:hypothetical protein
MNLPHRYQQNFLGALLVCLVLLGGLSAAWQPSLQVWGKAVSGLQMTIYIDQAESAQSKVPKFRVELHNYGDTDLFLNLGVMTGGKQYPGAVDLSLTDARGKSRRFVLSLPPVGGRLDFLVLPLPSGATFSIPVDLENYWTAAPKKFDNELTPGTYFLEAQFTGKGISRNEGIALMPNWTGTVASNRLQFDVSSQ